MEINLPPDVAAIIDRQLASGQYHSPTEVIVQALWLLDGWNDSEGERLEKLRQAAQEGLAGPFVPGQEAMAAPGPVVSGKEFFAQLREEMAA